GFRNEAVSYLIYLIGKFEKARDGGLTRDALITLGDLDRIDEAFAGILALLQRPDIHIDIPARGFAPIFRALAEWGMADRLLPHLEKFYWKGLIVFKLSMWLADQGKPDDALVLLWPPLAQGKIDREYLAHAAAFYCARTEPERLMAIA